MTNENLLSKKHSLEEATNSLSDLTEKFTAAENAFNDSQKKLSGAEESISENRKLWKEVRETDSELRYAQENLKKAQSEKQSAEKTLSEQKKNREAIAHDIKEAEKEHSALNEYLKENEKDSELEQLVFKLESENNSFIKLTRDVNEKTKAISSNNNLIASKSEEKNTLQKDLDSLNSELKNLVSAEFKTVSLLIKNQLEEGKPCPVCGSLSHPSCTAASETNSIDEQNQKVASDISGLNKKIDEAEKNITTFAAEINALTEKSSQLESEKNQLTKELESSGEKLNTQIAPWNYSITQKDFEQLPEIINALSLRNKKFSENTKLKDELENKKKILETKLEAIDLKKLETSLSDAEKIFIDAENNYKTILKKRHELFGEKNVDTEEQSAEENVLALKKSASQKESEKNTILQAKTKVTADIENFTKDIKTLSEKSEEALRKFNEALSKNSFASREEFLAFRMKDSEIENLNTIKQSLIKMDGETKNALETARNALEKLSGENLSQKTEAELLESQNQCIKIQEENSEKIGSITTQLEFNSAQKDKAAVVKKKLEDARKKSDLWNEMADFIGKKADGSDFEVFVEALAFKQLLKIANSYVEAITKQYTLVQVEGKVDFLIHDINYPDSKDDRPVNNMSGGEKFIISLSLALGIAELASRNVRVDSLFLDEGFGTLSGEPLMEAITALKSLQNSGKMLGIITHIDTVIREFDLKIEAGKNLSGVSELKGPGVSHEV